MIDDPLPRDWRDLQIGVCRLFNEVGLTAAIEVQLTTPRGAVTVDVHAIDERSVDRINYIVECKNWEAPIPQSIVHGFTTVMHETGANIGFIISKRGLQAGARQYTRNTNMVGLTYEQLQARYLQGWWRTVFCVGLGAAADTLIQYVEPINSRRERLRRELPTSAQEALHALQAKYGVFGMVAGMMSVGQHVPYFALNAPESVEEFKARLTTTLGDEFRFESVYFRTLLDEMVGRVHAITMEFHEVFGANIFERT